MSGKLSNLPLADRIAQSGAKLLLYLMTELQPDQDKYWNLNPSNPDHMWRISRASAQIIEAVAWVHCEEDVFLLVGPLAENLTHHSVKEEDRKAYHASRLRSVIQHCLYHCPDKYVLAAIANSIKYFLEFNLSNQSLDDDFILCIADLFGFIHNTREYDLQKLSSLSLSKALLDGVERKYAELSDRVYQIKNKINIDYDPKMYSYALWEIFGFYDINKPPVFVDLATAEADIRRLAEATKSFDKEHRNGKSSRSPQLIPQIIYPKLLLQWLIKHEAYNGTLDDFYEWLIPQADLLIAEKADPYLLGLALKAFIAANAEGVRTEFRRRNLQQTIIMTQKKTNEETNRALFTNIIQNSIHVEIDEKIDRLTGGWSTAQVWRVNGHVDLPLVSPQTGLKSDARVGRNQFRFIIKIGPKDNFIRAAILYSALSDQGKVFFPAHDQNASVIMTDDGPRFYLIMEELTDYYPIGRKVLESLPEDSTATPDMHILEWVSTGLDAIKNLHGIKPVNLSIFSQRSTIYTKVADVFEWVDAIRRKSPMLSKIADQEIIVSVVSDETEREYALPHPKNLALSIFHSLGKIQPKPKKGEFSRTTLVHGDCHANNIMASARENPPMFIDIDALHMDDYLVDYADYVAHLCFSLDLEPNTDDYYLPEITTHEKKKLRIRFDIPWNPSRFKILSDIFDLCRKSIQQLGEDYKDRGVDDRFLLLLGLRLLFVASKTKTPNKALVLYIQGIAILNYLGMKFTENRENPNRDIPLTLIELSLAPSLIN